jgi:hypothetical protein
MILYHSAYVDRGQEFPLTKGKVQIQSEGAEIFYKNIQITEIKKLPKNLEVGLKN